MSPCGGECRVGRSRCRADVAVWRRVSCWSLKLPRGGPPPKPLIFRCRTLAMTPWLRRRRGGRSITSSSAPIARAPSSAPKRIPHFASKKQKTLPDVQRLDLAYVSCAAGPARPDGELKRRSDGGQQPQRRPVGASRSRCRPRSCRRGPRARESMDKEEERAYRAP